MPRCRGHAQSVPRRPLWPSGLWASLIYRTPTSFVCGCVGVPPFTSSFIIIYFSFILLLEWKSLIAIFFTSLYKPSLAVWCTWTGGILIYGTSIGSLGSRSGHKNSLITTPHQAPPLPRRLSVPRCAWCQRVARPLTCPQMLLQSSATISACCRRRSSCPRARQRCCSAPRRAAGLSPPSSGARTGGGWRPTRTRTSWATSSSGCACWTAATWPSRARAPPTRAATSAWHRTRPARARPPRCCCRWRCRPACTRGRRTRRCWWARTSSSPAP